MNDAVDLDVLERELERGIVTASLADFFKAAWREIEASTPLLWNWHLDALCAHLQAQLEGWARRQSDATFVQTIRDLLATLPPGTAKSKALVIASAYAWARWPWIKMLALSGNPRIALRDSMLFRQIVTSRWYLQTFQPTWQIRDDQDAKGAIGNTAGGVRLAMGFDARAVGEHVDWIQVDDAHDPEQVESDATRTSILERWNGSWANRVNDLASSIRSGIAQRTYETDWSAARIAEGWVHLDLPMLFELDRACTTPLGSPDVRSVEGECLHPARFPPDIIAKERARVGERRWATLYQGRPAPRAGAMVQLADLRFWRHDAAPHVAARPKGCYAGPAVVLPAVFEAVVIAGDLAGGKLTTRGDFNALVAIGRRAAQFYLLEFWIKRAGFPEVQDKVRGLARRYPGAKKIIESAASGAALVASLESEIVGLVGKTATGDKESRLESVLSVFEAGQFFVPDGAPGLDALIASVTTFPNAAHDDDVDAISLALSALIVVDPDLQQRRLNVIRLLLGSYEGPHEQRLAWLQYQVEQRYAWIGAVTERDLPGYGMRDTSGPAEPETQTRRVDEAQLLAADTAWRAGDRRPGKSLGYVFAKWQRQRVKENR